MPATPLFTSTGSRPFALRSLDIPAAAHVLVLAPHPDDFDAIAVTLRLFHEKAAEIAVHVLTSGASGVQDGFPGARDAAAKAALREEEQETSCRLFGLPRKMLHFERLKEDATGEMSDNADNYRVICGILVDEKQTVVFMPHFNDTNHGHQRAYAMARRCIFEKRLSLDICLNRDPKTLSFSADMHMSFGNEDAAWKGKLLRAHATQHKRNLDTRGKGFDERILDCNRKAAQDANLKEVYAEVFQIESYVSGNPSKTARP